VIYRETIGAGFGDSLAIASFSFLPIYGSFLLAWNLLYERSRLSLGEAGITVNKRYAEDRGKIGERLRLGTKLWFVIPMLMLATLVIAPMAGWNERSGDSLPSAVREGRMKDVVAYLERGDDPNSGRGPGNDPMMVAVQSGDEAMVRMLAAKGAKLDSPKKLAGPLHYAVLRRRPEMVKLLLSLGAAIDSVDDRENSALMLAAKNGQTEVVRFLLSKGADKGLRDANGLTALAHAKGQGHQDIVQLLEGK
jgi:hypothetical protein